MKTRSRKHRTSIDMWRKVFFSAAIAAPAIILMQPAPAAPPPGDSVTGSGIAVTGEAFSIDASSKADGKAAHGTMTFSVVDPVALGDVTVRVTCLSVSGAVAFVGGRIVSSTSSAFNKNDGVRWFVRDDNNPDDLRIEPAPPPLVCSTAQTSSPIQSGTLAVVDN
jgi:hypothetical protein